MPEDVRTCPLCGCERSALFDRRSHRGRDVTNRLCFACGLVFQSPRMTASELAAFYAEAYRLEQEGVADPTARNISVQKARADSLVGFIKPALPVLRRHLDIGCSLGILLERVQVEYKTQAVGIEPSEAHRAQAGRDGLRVYPAMEDLERAGEPPFDLVSMSHVLEHLPDPVSYLCRLREQVVTPDGGLLVEVPNLFAHDCFETAHLFSFSPHTLQEVLGQGGFTVIKSEIHRRPSSAILPLFVTVLCRPLPQGESRPICPERGVAFKRRLGMLRRDILARLFPRRAWLVQG